MKSFICDKSASIWYRSCFVTKQHMWINYWAVTFTSSQADDCQINFIEVFVILLIHWFTWFRRNSQSNVLTLTSTNKLNWHQTDVTNFPQLKNAAQSAIHNNSNSSISSFTKIYSNECTKKNFLKRAHFNSRVHRLKACG